MRLIDADALIEAHYNYCNTHHGEADVFWSWSLRLMKNAPTIDAEPVRRGHWIDTGSGQECSVCHEIQYGYDNYRYYCPYCGAQTKYVQKPLARALYQNRGAQMEENNG